MKSYEKKIKLQYRDRVVVSKGKWSDDVWVDILDSDGEEVFILSLSRKQVRQLRKALRKAVEA